MKTSECLRKQNVMFHFMDRNCSSCLVCLYRDTQGLISLLFLTDHSHPKTLAGAVGGKQLIINSTFTRLQYIFNFC